MKDKKKIAAAHAGVYNYIKSEKRIKKQEKKEFNIWGIAGRMEMMEMRRLLQFRLGTG
ncbi:MAG: hypothetical protein SV062_01415 [Thermodesulfobacteriota bacterium]|nr:hypothetical protein [Thermodesulfobacteriota bacterium]